MLKRRLGAACLIMAVGLAATTALAGRPPAITLNDAGLDVLINRGGRPEREGVLPPDSRAIGVLHRLLESGRWGWTLVTYVPNVYVRSDKFTVNVFSDKLIVNHETHHGHWHQVVRDITSAEYDEVSRAISEGMKPR